MRSGRFSSFGIFIALGICLAASGCGGGGGGGGGSCETAELPVCSEFAAETCENTAADNGCSGSFDFDTCECTVCC